MDNVEEFIEVLEKIGPMVAGLIGLGSTIAALLQKEQLSNEQRARIMAFSDDLFMRAQDLLVVAEPE